MVYASYISIKYPAIFWYFIDKLDAEPGTTGRGVSPCCHCFDTLLISWMQNQGQQAGGYHPAAIARDIGAIEARVIGLKVPIAKIKNDSRKNHNSKHKAAINKWNMSRKLYKPHTGIEPCQGI